MSSLLKQRVAAQITKHNVKKDETTIKNRVLQELRKMYKDVTEKFDKLKLKTEHEKRTQEVGDYTKVTNMLTESQIET